MSPYRVVCGGERLLQLLQLLQRERGPVAPLLAAEEGLVRRVQVAVVRHRGICGSSSKKIFEAKTLEVLQMFFHIGLCHCDKPTNLYLDVDLHGWAGLKGSSSEGSRAEPPREERGLW